MDKVLSLIDNPGISQSFSCLDWNILISQARFNSLVPYVYYCLLDNDLIEQSPKEVKEIFSGYVNRLNYHHKSFMWEFIKLNELANKVGYPVVILKGVAYLASNVGSYKSRNFSDIDVLIHPDNFKDFEQLLLSRGWEYKELNDYDDAYYRNWSHASPPMYNNESGIELDLHHHIASPISDVTIDTDEIFSKIQPINDNVYRLSNADLILHCANHLIYQDELQDKFKDLLHIKAMIKDFSGSNIWQELERSSKRLKLELTLFYTMALLEHYFNEDIPVEIKSEIFKSNNNFIRKCVLALIKTTISTTDPDSLIYRTANQLLIMRYQWTRYPIHILTKHLLVKHILNRLRSN